MVVKSVKYTNVNEGPGSVCYMVEAHSRSSLHMHKNYNIIEWTNTVTHPYSHVHTQLQYSILF